MKLSKPKTTNLTIRISEEDLRLFKAASAIVGSNPSTMIRMFINASNNAIKIRMDKGELKDADIEALLKH